jgi:hypothetical protein
MNRFWRISAKEELYKYSVGGTASRKTKKRRIKTAETCSESQLSFSVARKKHKIENDQSKKYNPKNCNVLLCLTLPLHKNNKAKIKAVNIGIKSVITLNVILMF